MPGPSEAELRERYSRLSTHELMRIVAARPNDYTPVAVRVAREILATRGASVGPEERKALARERFAPRDPDLDRRDQQRQGAARAGLMAILLLFGMALLGVGVGVLLGSPAEEDLAKGAVAGLIGAGLFYSGVRMVRAEKRRAARLEEEGAPGPFDLNP